MSAPSLPVDAARDLWPPLPPPARRRALQCPRDVEQVAVRLLHEHAHAVQALSRRNPADLSLMPGLAHERAEALRRAFDDTEPALASWIVEIAPLLAPRLLRLKDRLRRRLARVRLPTPLDRLREMDANCLRRNARRPGRTLVEQAGPKQTLLSVHRIERFDTTENRALVSTCRRLLLRTEELLRDVVLSDKRIRPDARALVALQRAARTLLDHPSLDGIGGLRAAERPSHALLGDADYRAVWRTWLLLRHEDTWFEEDWRVLPRVWAELVLVATWSHLDTLGWQPVPASARISAHRDEANGARIVTSSPRRWVLDEGDACHVVDVRPADDMRSIVLEGRSVDGETCTTWTRTVPAMLLCAAGTEMHGVSLTPITEDSSSLSPDRRSALGIVVRSLTALPSSHARRMGITAPAGAVGLCAMDAHVWAVDDTGQHDLGPACVSRLLADDGTELTAVGRSATWNVDAIGPASLHSNEIELGGALLSTFRGHGGAAVVVPDTLDELQIAQLRRSLGPVWRVWSVVAAALAAAERPDTPLPVLATGETWPVLVAVLTDAGLDVSILDLNSEEREGQAERLWIRSRPPRHDRRGRLARMPPAPERSGGLLQRDRSRPTAWWLDVDQPTRFVVPNAPDVLADVLGVVPVAARPSIRAAIFVGFEPPMDDALTGVLPIAQVVALPVAALAQGARVFLERHQRKLPTWKDRLPRLAVEVRRDRQREQVDIVERGAYVAPGDTISFTARNTLVLDRGLTEISLPIAREDVSDVFRIVMRGPPLPLDHPTAVRVHVRFRYGEDALEGELRPETPHPRFNRIPFVLGATVPTSESLKVIPAPPRKESLSIDAERFANLVQAARTLEEAWTRLPNAERKKASQQPGVADPEMRPRAKALREALDNALDDGRRAFSPAQAASIEDAVLPVLDWLLDVRPDPGAPKRRGPEGRPPILKSETRIEIVRTRAATGIRGASAFARGLVDADTWGLPAVQRLLAWGRVVDGRDDRIWQGLLTRDVMVAAERGAWARAVGQALLASPALLSSLSAESIHECLSRALDHLDALVLDGPEVLVKQKQAVYYQLHLVTTLCLTREHGELPPTSSEARDAIERLERTRAELPTEARAFAQSDAWQSQDEPISTAIDFLRGHYVATARSAHS